MKKLLSLLFIVFTLGSAAQQTGDVLDVIKNDYTNSKYLRDNFPNIDVIHIGYSIENIGDLNQDGISDLAVGAINPEGNGAVVIFFLKANGTIKGHTIISENQGGLVNNLPTDFDWFGQNISNIGDLDGDGVTDLAVGSYEAGIGGEVFILFLNKDGTVKKHTRIGSKRGGFPLTLTYDNSFGYSVANIGDLNQDGVNDIAVGDYSDYENGINRGAAYILFLNKLGEVIKHQKINDSNGDFNDTLNNDGNFGSSLTSLSNGRIVVGGQRNWSNVFANGAIWVLNLNDQGIIQNQVKITENQSGFDDSLSTLGLFGSALANIGDIDGDGIEDIAVGSRRFEVDGIQTGAMFILLLNENGTVKQHLRYANNATNPGYQIEKDDRYGIAITGIKDFNGDGKFDIAVGISGLNYLSDLNKGGFHLYFLEGYQHVGIKKVTQKNIVVYPNPTQGTIHFQLNELIPKNSELKVLDLSGKLVLQKEIHQNATSLPEISNGMYQFVIQSEKQQWVGRFVVQR